MTTWMCDPARLDYLWCTLNGICQYLIPSEDGSNFARILVSCEGRGNDTDTFHRYQEFVDRFKNSSAIDFGFFTRNGTPGIGDQLNFLLAMVPDDAIFMYIQDDWELRDWLDIDFDVTALRNDKVDMIRYRWWPEPDPKANLEQIHPGYRVIDVNQSWIYSDTPFIARRDLFTRAGIFRPGNSEGEFSQRLKNMMHRGEKVRVWGRGKGMPWHSNDEFFIHIGEKSTIQGRLSS